MRRAPIFFAQAAIFAIPSVFNFFAEILVILGLVDGRVSRAVDDKVDRIAGSSLLRGESLESGRRGDVYIAVRADSLESVRFQKIRKLGAEHTLVADKPDHFAVSFKPVSPGCLVSLSERSGSMPISGQTMPIAGSFQRSPPSSSGW